MEETKREMSSVDGVLLLILIMLTLLKAMDKIVISWWVVFVPLWMPPLLGIALLVTSVSISLIYGVWVRIMLYRVISKMGRNINNKDMEKN